MHSDSSRLPATNFFDLQVNGYAGVDFNSPELTIDQLRAACERLGNDGVMGFLATIFTADLTRMAAQLALLADFCKRDALVREMIVGFHIEGPFIQPQHDFAGAHPPEHIRPADSDVMRRLLDAGGDLVRLVTLAPECDPGLRVTRMLSDRGIVIAAGHCDPTIDQLRAAIDAGLTMFTHLGNACPAMLPKHDNVIHRVLSLADKLWITFIADGAHIPFAALGNYLKCVGYDRAIVITDSMAAARLGPGRFKSGVLEVLVGDDLVPRLASDPSSLAGSALTMPRAEQNLREHLRLNDHQLRQLLLINPCQAIGMSI